MKSQTTRKGGNKRQEAVQKYNRIRIWLDEHKDFTADDLQQFADPEDRFNTVRLLTKNILEHPEYLEILKTLAQTNFLPKIVQKAEYNQYSLYNTAAFLKTCNAQTFKNIVEVIHLYYHNIFEQNNKGENALMAVLSSDNPITQNEKLFRYWTIAQIMPEQISKLLISCFNKIDTVDAVENLDKIAVDRLIFALCVNPSHFLKTLASLLIKRKCPEMCTTHDLYIFQYVRVIIAIFTSVHVDEEKSINNYSKMQVTDKSLEVFFKLNKNNKLNMNVLFKQLWKELCTVTLPVHKSNESNESNESDLYNFHALALTIGGFANSNILLAEYMSFIMDCLNPNNSTIMLDADERPKLAIRAVIHAKKLRPEIIAAFTNYPTNDGFVRATIVRVTNKTDSIYTYQKKQDNKPKQEINVETISFFEGLTEKNYEDVAEDTVYLLEKYLKEYPNQKIMLTRRVIFCLLDSMTLVNIGNIPVIIRKLVTCIPKSDILSNKKYIEVSIIPSLDKPNSFDIWKEITKCL